VGSGGGGVLMYRYTHPPRRHLLACARDYENSHSPHNTTATSRREGGTAVGRGNKVAYQAVLLRGREHGGASEHASEYGVALSENEPTGEIMAASHPAPSLLSPTSEGKQPPARA
jgi:hypothetical protein